ncbi:MAG: hypothetical protein JNM28_13415 [Armatimonadetes bacterium]|nr:hypothetical protein [Armatimonadota bacterium]MBS1711459.1 hypothetical protein [Armatimonadota bacterium]MBX3107616.1 hypothetical protein [Fimbriimonadaceae bacterium]
MSQPERKRKPVLIGGLIVLGVLSLVLGGRYLKQYLDYQDAIGLPDSTLEQRIDKLGKLGASLEGQPHEFYKDEFITQYAKTPWIHARDSIAETPEIAGIVLADPTQKELLAKQAADVAEPKLPSYNDFLNKRKSMASKRVTSSLRSYALLAIQEGRLEDAVASIEMMSSIQQAVVREPSEAAIVFWYGVNADLLRLAGDLVENPKLTPDLKDRLLAVVSPELPVMSLKPVVVRYAQELMQLGRQLPDVSKEDMSVIEVATMERDMPKFSKTQTKRAIQGRLAQVFIDILEQSDFSEEHEVLGKKIDKIILDRQKAGRKIETDYLVDAIPYKFEQFGRMTVRILQARAVLNVLLTEGLKPGSKTIQMAGFPQTVNVEIKGGKAIATCKSVDREGFYTKEQGLEINQDLGIRYVSPPKTSN